jgi:hypothetical protein
MHQAHAGAGHGQTRTQGHGTRHAALHEGFVDAFGFVEAPGAHADAGMRAVRAPGQKAAVGGFHAHRLAGIGLALGDTAFEHPGVAPLKERSLLGDRRMDFMRALSQRGSCLPPPIDPRSPHADPPGHP